MEEKKDEKKRSGSTDPHDFSTAWMKSAMDLWQGMHQLWLDPMMQSFAGPGSSHKQETSTQASLDAAMKKWQAFVMAMSGPESMDALFKSVGTIPGMLAQLAQSTSNGFFHIQQKWLERAGRLGEATEAYQFQNLDENIFHTWTETYKKEFQQFFRIPQLGLARSYQEKIQQVLDKSTIFQSTMSEYIRMMSLPIRRSFTVMDEQLAQMVESGKLPSDPQEYYRLWVKILEGLYMTMYRSSEYLETLGKTLNALTEYSEARGDVCGDILSMMSIPNRKEIDELEREVFELKKRLRALEKKHDNAPEKEGR